MGDAAAANENWHFVGPFEKMTFASRMQRKIYWGPLQEPIAWTLKTFLAPWAYIASVLYHDTFWYPAHQKIAHEIIHSEWGRLFHNWEKVAIPPGDLNAAGWKEVGRVPAELKRETLNRSPTAWASPMSSTFRTVSRS